MSSLYPKITLKEFLFLFDYSDDTTVLCNIINTANETFPERYRCCFEHPATLFRDIMKDGNPDNILDRYIESIALKPAYEKEIGQYALDTSHGFYTIEQTRVYGNTYKDTHVPQAAAIHIKLSSCEYKEKYKEKGR